MRRLILVPLDASTFAEQALPHAVMLARRARVPVQLVSVRLANPPAVGDGEEQRRYLGRLAEQLEPQLPGAISYEVMTNEFGSSPDPPSLSQAVADALARYVSEHEVDICVMATHGRGGVQRAWLGSVADSMIRIAPRPVLLIRPKDEAFGAAVGADRGIRHVVIAVDGSETAEQVIPFALRIGTPFDAHYTLLRVVSQLAWGASEAGAAIMQAPLGRGVAVEYVERLAAVMREQGASVTARVIDAFSPGPAIVDYANEHAADVIAISTEGAGRVRRLLLGSVTDKIVRSSDVPVLVCNIRRLESVTDVVRGSTATAVSAVR